MRAGARNVIIGFVLAAMTVLAAPLAPGGTPLAQAVVVSWAPVTQNWDGTPLDDLAGYRVYWGQQSRAYRLAWDVPAPDTALEVANAEPGYYAVAAYDQAGNFSEYSAEVAYSSPPLPQDSLPRITWAADKDIIFKITLGARPTGTYEYEVEWLQIDTTTADTVARTLLTPDTDFHSSRGPGLVDTVRVFTQRLVSVLAGPGGNPQWQALEWVFRVRLGQGVWHIAPAALRVREFGRIEKIEIVL